MKTKVLLVGAILLLALSVAYAADVNGKWVAESQGRNGPTQTTFNLKAEGAKLTGTVTLPGMMGGQPTDVAITEGKVEGDNISFVAIRKVGQNQEIEIKTTYKGAVSGDEIKFTVERQMPAGGMGGPGGGPGGGAPGGGGPGGGGGGRGMGGPQEIVAKRVK